MQPLSFAEQDYFCLTDGGDAFPWHPALCPAQGGTATSTGVGSCLALWGPSALQGWSEPGYGSHFPDIHVIGLAAASSNASPSADTSMHIPARSPLSLPCPFPPQLARSDARGKAALRAAELGQERELSSEQLGGSSVRLVHLFIDGVHHRFHL